MNFLICFITLFSAFSFNANLPHQKDKLTVNNLFADHMVLQQNDKVAVWGEASPNKEVIITASWGEKVATNTNPDGKWSLKLKTPKAGGPFKIRIESAGDAITIKDVLIGEVWLASGQSNMDIPLGGWLPKDSIMHSKEEIAKANYPEIRFLKVPFNISATPLNYFSGDWTALSPQTSGSISATAFFFAKKLYQQLHVPIGIVQSSIGGTPAEAWTSEDNLKKLGDFNEHIGKLKNLQSGKDAWLKKWKVIDKPLEADQWKALSFDDATASGVAYNDESWKNIFLPGRFDILHQGEFDGAMWVRKKFTITDLSSPYKLHFDAIDDMDATFINGVCVGALVGDNVANAPRDYEVPITALHKGENNIAIRLIDTGGPGAVSGKMIIFNQKESISLAGIWKSQMVAELLEGKFYSYGLNVDLSKRPDLFQMNSNSPTVLFNAMINPLIPFTFKGVIWYQGESNVGRGKQYEKLFPLMINDWRNHWGYMFPFYYVQIAPYLYTDASQREQSQKIRNAQRLALKTPETGMVTTLDIGRLDSAHPTKKREVGNRLARFALANQYGKKMVTSGPLFQKAEPVGNILVVSFEKTSIGSGLSAGAEGLKDFEIAGADKVFKPAIATLKSNQIIVKNSAIEKPVYVRYAWSDGASATLFNKEGLPASTFTSETDF